MAGKQLLLMDGIHKRFGPLIVSAGVTLDVEENEFTRCLAKTAPARPF